MISEGLARTLAPPSRDSYLSSEFIGAGSHQQAVLTIYSHVGERWPRPGERELWSLPLPSSGLLNVHSAVEFADVLFLLPGGRPRFFGGLAIHASGFPHPSPRLLANSSRLEIVLSICSRSCRNPAKILATFINTFRPS